MGYTAYALACEEGDPTRSTATHIHSRESLTVYTNAALKPTPEGRFATPGQAFRPVRPLAELGFQVMDLTFKYLRMKYWRLG
jgi:hypothetical protein